MASHSRSCFALIFAGLVTVAAGAQVAHMEGAATRPAKTTLTMTLPSSASCPISMSARHGLDKSTIEVSRVAHRGLGQQIELMLNNPGNTTISAIRITVHGWNGSLASVPVTEANSSRTSASRTIEIRIPIAPRKTTKTSLWISGLTSVDSIDLVEVRYARGLSWRPSADHACRIVPDAETLISLR